MTAILAGDEAGGHRQEEINRSYQHENGDGEHDVWKRRASESVYR